MKILHIIDSLSLGGAQTIVKGILETNENGDELYLFVLRQSQINLKIDHSNIFIYGSRSKYSLVPLFELISIIKHNRIHVLHCHLVRSFLFGYLIKLIHPRLKLIFHEHGMIFTDNRIFFRFLKISKNSVNLCLAVSENTKKELIRKANFPEDKIRVLYNFTQIKRLKKADSLYACHLQKPCLGAKEEFVIGYVGRLTNVKGCSILICALPYLKFKYKVVIAGTGLLRGRLQKLADKLGVGEHVLFLGYVSDIEKFYKTIDILIIPSLSESFGLTLIESQAAGVPVIASNIPAFEELLDISESALLFDVGSHTDLAEKISQLNIDKKRRKFLSQAGFKNASKYTIQVFNSNLSKLYSELFNR